MASTRRPCVFQGCTHLAAGRCARSPLRCDSFFWYALDLSLLRGAEQHGGRVSHVLDLLRITSNGRRFAAGSADGT